MTSTNRQFSKTRRYAVSVVATAVVAVGAVACGTETVDDVDPATPAQVKVPAQGPADLAKERYEVLKRHYLPPADSHKAAERNIEKEQQYEGLVGNGSEQDQDRSRPYMGRPGSGL